MGEVMCGKCGSKLELVHDNDSDHEWFACVRCGYMDTIKGHIQERDRRIEAAFLARAAGPGCVDSQLDHPEAWSHMSLVCMATKDVLTLDAAAQGRTK